MHLLLQIAGQKSQTAVMPNTRSPVYNSHSEFFNLQLHDTLTVQVGQGGKDVRQTDCKRPC